MVKTVVLTDRTKLGRVQSGEGVELVWLLRARWGLFVGQVVLGATAMRTMGVEASQVGLMLLIALTGSSNAVLSLLAARQKLRSTHGLRFSVLLADVALLWAILLLSGGPANPFSVFFVVHVALAALVLDPVRRWVVVALTGVAFGSLFMFLSGDEVMRAMHRHGVEAHLQGMWLSYCLVAAVVGAFVSKLATALVEREKELRSLSARIANAEKAAALSALAGGAAHELSTPLATVGLIASEMSRSASAPERWREDAKLLEQAVERCRAIVERMKVPDRAHGVASLNAVRAQAEVQHAKVMWKGTTEDIRVACSEDAVLQVLTVLIDNAWAANAKHVHIEVHHAHGEVALVVVDDGAGIADDVLPHLGEPWVTTKQTGQGKGLGLFFASRLLAELKGSLEFETSSQGTRATVVLPVEPS